MKPAGRLDVHPWMDDPAVAVLFAALGRAGIVARFVGGCVRNAVLGHPINDYDLAVDKSPQVSCTPSRRPASRSCPPD